MRKRMVNRVIHRILAAEQLDWHNIPERESLPPGEDLWAVEDLGQEFDSAETSLNQIPSTFKTVDAMKGWKAGTLNCDIGGGREFPIEGESTHKFTVALKSRGVTNAVFDPFNRTVAHNTKVAAIIRDGQSDTVTVNNVLNVIKEPQIRNRVIRQAANALKTDGTAYFLIYEGDKSGVGKDTKKGRWQNNMSAADYLPEIKRAFSSVRRKGNLIIAQH